MELPVMEIEDFVRKESGSITVYTHALSHFMRVADGAVWFVGILGGSEREKQLARIAGLLHDIVRPADEAIDHAIASAERSRNILQQFRLEKGDIDAIVQAIRDHRLPVEWKSPLHQSVYLADKILEQMGAYLVFRRCMYVAESVTYDEKLMKEAINEHFAMRIKRIPKDAFPERFSRLVDYQYKWITDAQKALKDNKQWIWDLAEFAYNNGKTHALSLDGMIRAFRPASAEAEKIKKEATDYIEGRLFSKFSKLV